MKCSTCHEVHGRTSHDLPAYEESCLACHQQTAAQRACPVSPKANCVGCHMPKVKVAGGWNFTDHWIRKPDPTTQHRTAAAAAPPLPAGEAH